MTEGKRVAKIEESRSFYAWSLTTVRLTRLMLIGLKLKTTILQLTQVHLKLYNLKFLGTGTPNLGNGESTCPWGS